MDYGYGYGDYDSLFVGLLGGFSIVLVILGIFILAWAIVSIIALWKVYKKAGKGGWECIVPFYSYYVLTEIAGLNWWWFLLAIVDSIVTLIDLDGLSAIASLVSVFARFNIYYNIAKKFNKTNGTAVCAGIFSGIFILIFGFSKDAVYNANIPVSKNGIFGAPESSNNTYNNYSNQGNTQYQTNYNNMSNMNNMNSMNNTDNVNSMDNINRMDNVVEPMMNTNNQEQKDISNISNDDMNVEQPVDNSNDMDVTTQEFSFCGNCGTKLNKDARFCPNCGKENQ